MTRKTTFFEGWSWFKFNNLGLALGMTLQFVAKELKLKVRMFWWLILTFVAVTGEKLIGVASPPATSLPPKTLWLLNVITPFKIKIIEKPHTVLLPDLWFLNCNKKFKNSVELEFPKNWPGDEFFKLRKLNSVEIVDSNLSIVNLTFLYLLTYSFL